MRFLPLLFILSSLVGNNQIPGTEQKRPILLRGGILHTVSGDILEGFDMLFLRAELLLLMSRFKRHQKQIYRNLWKTCSTGYIAGYTRIGLTEISAVKQTNDHSEVGEINPNVRANVAYNPDSDLIPVTRSNGILVVNSTPASGRISGQSSVMALDGWTWEDATIKHPSGLNINWPNMYVDFSKKTKKNDKAQIDLYNEKIRELNQLIRNVRAYHQRRNARERKAEQKQQTDLRLESMIPFVIEKEPIHIKANDIRQIEAAVNWASEHDLNIVIVGGRDAWINPELLVKYNIPVILLGVQVTPDAGLSPYTFPTKYPIYYKNLACISVFH